MSDRINNVKQPGKGQADPCICYACLLQIVLAVAVSSQSALTLLGMSIAQASNVALKLAKQNPQVHSNVAKMSGYYLKSSTACQESLCLLAEPS